MLRSILQFLNRWQVTPRLLSNDCANRLSCYSMPSRFFAEGKRGYPPSPANIDHLGLGESGLRILFASHIGRYVMTVSTPTNHVLRVVFGGSVIEMLGIATRRVVAIVARSQFGRARAISNLGGDSRGNVSRLADCHQPISIATSQCRPFPASVWTAGGINTIPETCDCRRGEALLTPLDNGVAGHRAITGSFESVRLYPERLATLFTNAIRGTIGVHAMSFHRVPRLGLLQQRRAFSLPQLYPIRGAS